MNALKLFKPPRYFIRGNAIWKILKKTQYESILEIGYGDGYVISSIKNSMSTRKYGFEISETARKSAKKTLLNLKF